MHPMDDQTAQIYYHVISDVPKRAGEHILIDEQHPNRVHLRVHRQLDTVRAIYESPCNYAGQQLPHEVAVALRELALEQVRREKYPQYPSRMAALYVSRSFDEANDWGDFFARIGRPTYGIAKIKAGGRMYIGDACKCFDGTISEAENLRLAERYWQSAPAADGERPIVEILVDGDVEILEIVREINANIPR